jgi:hypothetical protein
MSVFILNHKLVGFILSTLFFFDALLSSVRGPFSTVDAVLETR